MRRPNCKNELLKIVSCQDLKGVQESIVLPWIKRNLWM